MGNKLLTYKRMVNTMVIITETLICGGLFGLFYSWAQGSSYIFRSIPVHFPAAY